MSTRPYLGVNINAASVEEMRYRGLLEEGETLLALFDGVLLDQSGRRVGGLAISDYVALTDIRVIIWARGFFNDTVDSFPWQDVDVVQAETWDPWHGRVQLAFRLPPIAPRRRRIAVNGSYDDPGSGERLVMNTLDYMPTDDVATFARMVELIGDQIVNGVTGEELIAAFVAEFPAIEREPLLPMFGVVEPAPPSPAEPPEQQAPPRRKRWWQVGRAGEEQHEVAPPANPGNLITAYERTRSGAPAGSGMATMSQSAAVGPLPTLPEQPNLYEVSRSLRIFLETPRRMAHGLRRASEAMGGANELVQGLQDPRVRRNAMRGLYRTAVQHEAEGGPLAPVGPVVRAAVRFAEPTENEQSAQQQSRRIQVRSSVRRAPMPIEPEGGETLRRAPRQVPTPGEQPSEANARPEPVRRSISVRRVEQPPPTEAPETTTEVEEEAQQVAPEPQRTVPVRRIAIGRSERAPAPEMSLVPDMRAQHAEPGQNGVHQPDDEA